MMMEDTYWYLATPYTNFEGGHEAAWIMACEQTALLLKAGVPVFSPIAHTHPIAKVGGLKIVDHNFWVNVVDAPMMKGAHGIIHLAAKGWQKSSGMHEEIVHFVKAGKPVVFMEPGIIPPGVLLGHPKLPKPIMVSGADLALHLQQSNPKPPSSLVDPVTGQIGLGRPGSIVFGGLGG